MYHILAMLDQFTPKLTAKNRNSNPNNDYLIIQEKHRPKIVQKAESILGSFAFITWLPKITP